MAQHFFAGKSIRAHWSGCVLAAVLVGAAVGADPNAAPTPGVDAKKVATHWAFKRVTDPSPPAVHGESWCRNGIDRFVLHLIEEKGLHPSPEADRHTLVRRVYLDLTGLPPTPRQVDSFVHDFSPDAYERLVDTLLA